MQVSEESGRRWMNSNEKLMLFIVIICLVGMAFGWLIVRMMGTQDNNLGFGIALIGIIFIVTISSILIYALFKMVRTQQMVSAAKEKDNDTVDFV